jgi:hypothetical protein
MIRVVAIRPGSLHQLGDGHEGGRPARPRRATNGLGRVAIAGHRINGLMLTELRSNPFDFATTL